MFLLPPGWVASPSQGYPTASSSPIPIYTPLNWPTIYMDHVLWLVGDWINRILQTVQGKWNVLEVDLGLFMTREFVLIHEVIHFKKFPWQQTQECHSWKFHTCKFKF